MAGWGGEGLAKAHDALKAFRGVRGVFRRARAGQPGGAEGDGHLRERLAASEEEARRLREFAHIVLDNSPMGLFVLDDALTILFVNPQGARLLGAETQSLRGRPLTDFLPPDVLKERANRVRGGGVCTGIEVGLSRGRDRVPVNLKVVGVRLPAAGRPGDEGEDLQRARFIVRLEDLAERARLEASLVEREARYALLFNTVSDLVFVMKCEDAGRFRCLEVNQAYLEVTGLRPDQVVGRTPEEVLPPAAADYVLARYREAIRSAGPIRYEEDVVLPSGRVIVETTLTPVFDGLGRPAYLIGIARDVTARRRVEAERGRLAEIVERTPDFVFFCDPDGRVLYVNRAGRAALGIAEDGEVTRLDLADAHPPGERALLESQAFPAAVRDGYWSGEAALLARDGREIPVSEVIVAHRGAEGVAGFSCLARDISERRRLEMTVRRLAEHDDLTGLPNRRHFNARFAEVLDGMLRGGVGGVGGAVLLLDLDGFKLVNDTFGHGAGDDLLRAVAEILQQNLRGSDLLARLGGDEFAVLLPEVDATRALGTAERLVDALRRAHLAVADRPLNVTLSIGIALYPAHGRTVDALMACADHAMYQAKARGRNQAAVYDPRKDRQARRQARFLLALQRQLREALAADRFRIHLQPILDIAANRVVRYEALLRLLGPDGEVIHPVAFLKAAESSGLMPEIDRWVVRHAARLLAERTREEPGFSLSLNLSGRTLSDRNFPAFVREVLETSGADPSRLAFEVTETAVAQDPVEARRFIRALKVLGCRFGLDDFGAGFSSFGYLKELPVDFIKIDGRFVAKLPQSETDQHLVRAMADMARGLGKETVAEFVADGETLRLLRAMGVDHAQGYYVGRPRPPEEWFGIPGWAAIRGRAGARNQERLGG